MPRLRIGGDTRDVHLHGTVWDASDLLTSLTRTNLRSFVPGPWGPGDPELADAMNRRCLTAPCDRQCFVVQHGRGGLTKTGCSCSSGWQYTSDEDVQALEGCEPNDVWNDARALQKHHLKIGRGENDPILCDCDDLTAICGACAAYSAWKSAGSPMENGRAVTPPGCDIRVGITRPPTKNMAHAYMLSSWAPIAGEPRIKVRPPKSSEDLFVFDPAGRWGMKRPDPSFYGRGDVAVYRVRFEDL